MSDKLILVGSWIIAALVFAACAALIIASHDARAQISPATRPHTHAGASSGGSTLAPATLTVNGQPLNVGDGLAGTDARININGGTNTVKGSLLSVQRGGIVKAFIGTSDLITGDAGDNFVIQSSAGGTIAALSSARARCARNRDSDSPNRATARPP